MITFVTLLSKVFSTSDVYCNWKRKASQILSNTSIKLTTGKYFIRVLLMITVLFTLRDRNHFWNWSQTRICHNIRENYAYSSMGFVLESTWNISCKWFSFPPPPANFCYNTKMEVIIWLNGRIVLCLYLFPILELKWLLFQQHNSVFELFLKRYNSLCD